MFCPSWATFHSTTSECNHEARNCRRRLLRVTPGPPRKMSTFLPFGTVSNTFKDSSPTPTPRLNPLPRQFLKLFSSGVPLSSSRKSSQQSTSSAGQNRGAAGDTKLQTVRRLRGARRTLHSPKPEPGCSRLGSGGAKAWARSWESRSSPRADLRSEVI